MINYSIRRLKDVRWSVMRSHFMHQRSKKLASDRLVSVVFDKDLC